MLTKYALISRLGCLALLMLHSNPAFSQWFLDMEVGIYKPERNDVQIPNDSQGDRFKITDLGADHISATRVTLGWLLTEKHELQLVYAPFSYTQEGNFQEDIRFNGSTFSSSSAVNVRYQFSNYRLRYLYHWINSGRWEVDIGGTLFVRDASIKLSQNGTSSEDDDLGLVPLIAFRSTYSLREKWSMLLDTDFAIAPSGRAIDLALLGRYHLNEKLTIAAGYRTIEGGADTDDVYNFAWFNSVVMKASYSW